jgi:hypothetical protein
MTERLLILARTRMLPIVGTLPGYRILTMSCTRWGFLRTIYRSIAST